MAFYDYAGNRLDVDIKVDKTLKIEGAAADAKAVGDAESKLSESITDIQNGINIIITQVDFSKLECVNKTLGSNGGSSTNNWGISNTTMFYAQKGSRITVDSDVYTFQVCEYSIKGTPSSFIDKGYGLHNYGEEYVVKNNSYLKVCIRYADKVTTASLSDMDHLVLNIIDGYLPAKNRDDIAVLNEKCKGIDNIQNNLLDIVTTIDFSVLNCSNKTLGKDGGSSTNNWGISNDVLISAKAGSTITVDSADFEYQFCLYPTNSITVGNILDYQKFSYGTTYKIDQDGYLRLCIRYVDQTKTADLSTMDHLVLNIVKGYLPETNRDRIEEINKKLENIGGPIVSDYVSVPSSELKHIPSSVAQSKILSVSNMHGLFDALSEDCVTKRVLGKDQGGTFDIPVYVIKNASVPTTKVSDKKFKVLLIGGIHGSEKPSVLALYNMAHDIVNEYDKDAFLEWLHYEAEVHIIPIANPHGFNANGRSNSRQVDLNRNFDHNWEKGDADTSNQRYRGEAPFSEAETRLLRDYVEEIKPRLIIDFHSHGTDGDTWDNLCAYSIPEGDTDKFIRSGLVTYRKMTPITIKDLNLLNNQGTYVGVLQYDNGFASAAPYFTSVGYNSFTSECCYNVPNVPIYVNNDSSNGYDNRNNVFNYVWLYQTLLHAIRTVLI